MEENLIEVEVIADRELYYNMDTNFGIYGVMLKNFTEDYAKVKINAYGNITIKGSMPRLDIGQVYKVKAEEVETMYKGEKQYQYITKMVSQDLPTSLSDQKAYLLAILTPLQVQAIYDAYEGEDVIQLFIDGTFDYRKVHNFGEVVYERVRRKILDNLDIQQALVELTPYGVSYNAIITLIAHYNNSASILVQNIKENPYLLTVVNGFGFKKVDGIAIATGIEPESPHRILACMEYILDEYANSDGHCWIKKDKLIKDAVKLLKIDKKHIVDMINKEANKENNSKFKIDNERIGAMSYYLYEYGIYENVKRLLGKKFGNFIEPKEAVSIDYGMPMPDTDDKDLKLERPIEIGFSDAEIEARIKIAEEKQGFVYTDEQRRAIEYACKYNMVIIDGKAGTGKTSVLKGVLNVLGSHSYETCALSGKASQRIMESTGFKSKTIHRMLGWNPMDGGFAHNAFNQMPVRVCVIDEMSMNNNYIFFSVIQAIYDGAKLILLGDTEQLEPIGVGNVFKDLIDSGMIPHVTLTQVHRQAMKSGILSTANLVREGIQFVNDGDYENKVLGELKDLHVRPYASSDKTYDSIIKLCTQFAKKKGSDLMEFQVITPLKKRGKLSVENLNRAMQEIFNPDENDEKESIERNGYKFREGDKIIQNGNLYRSTDGEGNDTGLPDIFNGTMGLILSVDKENKKMMIHFQGVGITEYVDKEISRIELAYASTVHRTQGSQFETVVFAMDYSAYKLLTRQLVYTALTRASKLCVAIFELEAMRHAIATNKASRRNTYLEELLKTDSLQVK